MFPRFTASSPCEMLPSWAQLTLTASFISCHLLYEHPDANHLQQARPDPGLQAPSLSAPCLLEPRHGPAGLAMRCLPHTGTGAFLSSACASVSGSSGLHITSSIINVVAFSMRTYRVKARLIMGVVTQVLIVPKRPMNYRPSRLQTLRSPTGNTQHLNLVLK